VAVIYEPGGYPFSVFDQWRILFASFVKNGFYNISDWKRWLKETDKHHPTEPHFYLEYIGVAPEHQGKGVGSALLQYLVEMADFKQIGCYLENANPRNTDLYLRFGFKIKAEMEIIGLPTWFMWRSPV